MSTIEDYYRIYKEYSKIYDRFYLGYQVGTFHNCYEYQDPSGETIGNAVEMADILGLRLTLVDTGVIHSKKNPFLIGIPSISIDDKYKEKVLRQNYVYIRYDQDPKDKTKRILYEIVTPNTSDKIINDKLFSNQILSIYIECLNVSSRHDKIKILCGISSIDLSTNRNHVSEIFTSANDILYVYQELYRVINAVKAREIILMINNYKGPEPNEYLEYIKTSLNLTDYPILIANINSLCLLYTSPSPRDRS